MAVEAQSSGPPSQSILQDHVERGQAPSMAALTGEA